MKPIILCIIWVSNSLILLAQVGINEENPKVTFHVNDHSKRTAVGILFPKAKPSELELMLSDSYDGTIVYITEPSTKSDKAFKLVDRKGYYYYDHQAVQWKPMGKRELRGPEKKRLFAHVTRQGPMMTIKDAYQENFVDWSTIQGLNIQDLSISPHNPTEIVFPGGQRTFRVTAMISILDVGVPQGGYIVGKFSADKPLAISSWGYVESNSEAYEEGGVTFATALFTTNNDATTLRLFARPASGGATGNRDRRIVIAGNEQDNAYYTTSLIIEEL